MSEQPKRFKRLGWIQVEGLRPAPEGLQNPEYFMYSGKTFLNLDMMTMIQFPDKTDRAYVHFPDGHSESLEDANLSRLIKAMDDATESSDDDDE